MAADVSEKMNNYVPVKIDNIYGWMYYPYLKNTDSSTIETSTNTPVIQTTPTPTNTPNTTETPTNTAVMVAVPEYDILNTEYVEYNGEKYYIQVPGYIRDNADYLDGNEWEVVKEFYKVTETYVDWETLIKEFDVYGMEDTPIGFGVDLLRQIMENHVSVRISISLQSNEEDRRAVIRTNIDVINHEGYINNSFSMHYLYRKYTYPNLYYFNWFKKKETTKYIDNMIRNEFDYSFQKDEIYDMLISLSEEHKNDIYSSYVAYNSSGYLMLYPIIYLDDELYIFKDGNQNDVVITVHDYFMGKIPFPQEYLKEIKNDIPK